MTAVRIGGWCAWTLASTVPAQGQESSNFDNQFRAVIAARYAAIARGDTAFVHRQLSEDLWWVIGTTGGSVNARQFLDAISHVQTPEPRYVIDSVHAMRLSGSVATVTYRRTDYRRVGAYEGVNSTRVLEVFIKGRDRWLLTEHSQTWIVRSPEPIVVDSAALDAFIGHYEIGPGYVDNVHQEGRALVATATGQSEGARLVPVSGTAFSPDGSGPLMVFERDATGRVVAYVQGLPDGQVVRARRVR